ncbi:hypothetical protein FGO68_gene9172 [Halteria grandinella]|uniref:Uncharacterized protein n=1 Tax=Halteria grandinella TaxID=5974 RepID=A0A8J8NHV2_HALGN|nr:hypothetical protein FGO68_gene9172 [Halteria grandinella]
MRKLNLLRKNRQELRALSISPKVVQEQVFNKFQDKLKGYEMKDISLSTKSRSVHSVAAMIQNYAASKPIDQLEPLFHVGQEHLMQFKQRRKFEENYIRMQVIKDMRDDIVKDIVQQLKTQGGYVPEEQYMTADGKLISSPNVQNNVSNLSKTSDKMRSHSKYSDEVPRDPGSTKAANQISGFNQMQTSGQLQVQQTEKKSLLKSKSERVIDKVARAVRSNLQQRIEQDIFKNSVTPESLPGNRKQQTSHHSNDLQQMSIIEELRNEERKQLDSMKSDEDLQEVFQGNQSVIYDEFEGAGNNIEKARTKKQSQSRITTVLESEPEGAENEWQVEEMPDGTMVRSKTNQSNQVKKGFLCFGPKAPKPQPPDEFKSQAAKPPKPGFFSRLFACGAKKKARLEEDDIQEGDIVYESANQSRFSQQRTQKSFKEDNIQTATGEEEDEQAKQDAAKKRMREAIAEARKLKKEQEEQEAAKKRLREAIAEARKLKKEQEEELEARKKLREALSEARRLKKEQEAAAASGSTLAPPVATQKTGKQAKLAISINPEIKNDPRYQLGKDGRKLKPSEQLIFYLLGNAEKKYGVTKTTLYERLLKSNPFVNLKNHSISSMNLLKSIKEGFKQRVIELQEKLKKSGQTELNNSRQQELNKQMQELEQLIYQLDNPNQTQNDGAQQMSFDEEMSFKGDEVIDAIGLTDQDKKQLQKKMHESKDGEGTNKHHKSGAADGENTLEFSFNKESSMHQAGENFMAKKSLGVDSQHQKSFNQILVDADLQSSPEPNEQFKRKSTATKKKKGKKKKQ